MTIRFLLDSNILSEPYRPMPNARVLQQLDNYRDEVSVASVGHLRMDRLRVLPIAMT
jgi:tRNA(fMet)-specific endonuclease VapC